MSTGLKNVTDALAVIDRLVATANGNDINARVASDFLLSWLSKDDWGAFSGASLDSIGAQVAKDVEALETYFAGPGAGKQPIDLAREDQIASLVYQWRSLD